MPPRTLPFHPHRSTYWLPSLTDRHTNTATASLSACHEALVKTLQIRASIKCRALTNWAKVTDESLKSLHFERALSLIPKTLLVLQVCKNQWRFQSPPRRSSLNTTMTRFHDLDSHLTILGQSRNYLWHCTRSIIRCQHNITETDSVSSNLRQIFYFPSSDIPVSSNRAVSSSLARILVWVLVWVHGRSLR